jgi:hypothetical protein
VRHILTALLVLSALGGIGYAQTDQPSWLPDGYVLLSPEDLESLPLDQRQAIAKHNREILDKLFDTHSTDEISAYLESVEQYAQTHELKTYERQFITRLQMEALSRQMRTKRLAAESERDAAFEKLLHDQERTTAGFPGDLQNVQTEARRIEDLIGRVNDNELYLQILRPLRARPWNEDARVVFRKIVRHDYYPGVQRRTLYEAALDFIHARERETPGEGAWDAMEAFLRLSIAGEIDEAKRLFDIAISKNSNDVESRIYPLLIAEIEGDEKKADRLRPRAEAAWPDPAALDELLFREIDMLPPALREKARGRFSAHYKASHPTDWERRAKILQGMLGERRYSEVAAETESVLALPLSILPEPYRTQMLALSLRAEAGRGNCPLADRISDLDREALVAYPLDADPDAPPVRHELREIAAAQKQLNAMREAVAHIEKELQQGSFLNDPDLSEIPAGERQGFLEASRDELKAQIAEGSGLVKGKDPARALSDWNAREQEAWDKSHAIRRPIVFKYDILPQAGRLSALVRSEAARCLIGKGDPLAAVSVLEGCVGEGDNIHRICAEPMVDAGIALAKSGQVRIAASIYLRLRGIVPADRLYEAIDKAAPDTVKRR